MFLNPQKMLQLIFLFILFPGISYAQEKGQPRLTILTENIGESNYLDEKGELKGHSVEIVKEILKRLGENPPIELMPWARGYYMTKTGKDTVLFSTTRTPEREKIFKWAGPLHISKHVFYAKKDFNKPINSIEDAKMVDAIGCIADDVRHSRLVKLGFTNIDPYYGVNANAQNLKKLMAGRIDLWISSYKDAIITSSQAGIPMSEIKEVLVLAKAYNYIAFSKDVSDETVAKWQKTLDEIKADGTYAKIMSRYPTGSASITFDRPGPVDEEFNIGK